MFYRSSGSVTASIHVPSRESVLLVLLCACTALLTSPAYAAAGRTPGMFAVSPTGSATYNIPIWTQTGPHGIQPAISLHYDSQSAIGTLGIGWSIAGLGQVTRCAKTVAQDTTAGPVALATSDGYCINGNRLRLTSGTYGTAGSVYQTEIADFSQVTANGTAGNGPGYFTVQGRDGLTYYYGYTDANGNGANSEVLANGTSTALTWLLSKVVDRSGNNYVINYTTLSGTLIGTAVPSTILWTPTSSGASTYAYSMVFNYGGNVPQSSIDKYVGGTHVSNTQILSSIEILYGTTVVKDYFLGYQASPTTSREELISVKECADSGASNCLLPTSIFYTSPTKGVSTTANTAEATTGGFLTARYDLNGDGYPDLVWEAPDLSAWYVAFGSPSGYGSPINIGINANLGNNVLIGRITGGTQDGVLANNNGTWYFYSWNGAQFTKVSTGVAYDSTNSGYQLADINGDGLPDLIELTLTYNSFTHTYQATLYTQLNTSTGGSASFSSTINNGGSLPALVHNAELFKPDQQYGRMRRYDFNGDGQDDLVLVSGSGSNISTYELISTGTAFTFHRISTQPGSTYVPVFFTDWNDDACTDFVTGGVLYVAGCDGTAPKTFTVSGTVLGALDWDGDGRTDLLVANGSTIGVYLSTGSGISSLVTTSIPYSSNCNYVTMDALGHGLDDLGCWKNISPYSVTYYLHNGVPDLVSQLQDGFGNSVSPSYVSIAQSNYTNYTDATYPYRNYIGAFYVVSQVVFSDPSSSSGGTYNQSLWYFGAWMNLQGRGGPTFYAIRTLDSRNALYYFQYFERSFPYTGMVFNTTVANSAFYLSQRVGTPASMTLSSTQNQQRYFPYFSNVTTSRKEVGGNENGDLITTISTNYTFDNYGNPTTITTTTTDNDPGSPPPYTGQQWTVTTTNTPDVDTTHWCLGLYTQTQVAYTSSLSGSNSVTRTKTLTPDTTNCRYTQIVTEPSSTQFKATEVIGYDSFGNVNSDSVTGVGMGTASPATRTTTINWTSTSVATGQFPMSAQDPSGAQVQLNYNLNYGALSSLTDPNNLITSWQYGDGFGRRTQENRPDGTYTTLAYGDCAPSNCLVGSHGLEMTQTVYGVGGGVITDGTTYLDSVDRTLISNQRLLASGAYNRNEVRYDNLGNLAKQAMPCTWTSVTTTCSYWTTNSYDVLNRLTQTQRPISDTNSTLQTITYQYAGRTTTVTDPQSNATVTVNDVNGWPRQAKDPMGYAVTRAYDAAGSVTQVTDSLGNTLWSGSVSYGISPFLVSSSDMDMGAWTYTVDALGEVTAWKDAKTQSFSATYDALSRPLTRTEPDPFFSQWTWGASTANHNVGKLVSACTGSGSTCSASGYAETETYDSLARLSQRAITLPGVATATYTWAYNSTTGLLDTLTYPTSTSSYALKLQYGYSNGILQTVTDISDSPNVTVWQANTLNPARQVTQETLGNGIVTSKTYDAVTYWLKTTTSGVGGGAAVKNLGFLYDEMGNLTQRQDNNLGLTENIYYDNDYRFSYSKLNGTQNLSVSYDGTGNISSRSDIANGATWTYDPVHKHQVTQAGSSAYQYSYDANGNANSRQGDSVGWSSYDYPLTVSAGSGSTAETVSFAYGPRRQRWQQYYTGNGTSETTDYIGGLLELVSSGSASDYRHYIYAGTEPVAVYSRKNNGVNTFTYLLFDHQKSVSSITNSSGAQVIGESFTPFGTRRNATTWSGPPTNPDLTTIAGITRQGYTFQTALGLWMGLNHMNGRVQDAWAGRFLSADRYIPHPLGAQNYNRYSYVLNNPLTFNDPSGFDPCSGGHVVAMCDSSGGGGGDSSGGGGSGFGGGSGGGTVCDANGENCTVTVCAKCRQADTPDWFFTWVIQPWAGWTTCPAEGCSSTRTLLSMATAPGVAGLAVVAAPAAITAATTVQGTAPVAVLSVAAAVTPDGVAVVAESMGVAGGAELGAEVGLAEGPLTRLVSYLEIRAFGK